MERVVGESLDKFQYDYDDVCELKMSNGKYQILYRIVALRDIKNPNGTIYAGEKGGYIFEGTLSQDDECWVADYAYVCKGCFVSQKAFVKGRVQSHAVLGNGVFVGGNGVVRASEIVPTYKVSVSGRAKIADCKIYGDVNLSGRARLESCGVKGYLSMTDDSILQKCEVEALGADGLSLTGNYKMFNKKLKGHGPASYADSVKVSDREKDF